ncbi:GTP 3',8-cyclase MoaA [Georgenia sp. SYP-B2076]|uniref:GTP 3',8-cyclase MoaA n=1 Tax=Georgenia sp. SYP-B2076 TaxID=2495881 RepID=UPI00197A8C3C|nr:GTP 3',8-cyclase MoaA [Georgenia sp. SYP-B2076]
MSDDVPADRLGRPLRDLRISVTDRCNFRCVYCMPKEVFGRDYPFLPKAEILTFEEIVRVARVAVAHGVEKVRLTGGEPLLRRGIEDLVAALAQLRTAEGRPVDIALTTNGSALAVMARSLKDAGLSRVSVSLDSLDPDRFAAMNDVDFPLARVLRGIEAAQDAGLAPVKVNMVVKRGTNDADILPMARHFKGTGVIVRFIEFMDVGATNGWSMDEVLPSAEVVARIDAELPVEAAAASHRGETATRWRYRDGAGEIGVISSVTAAFCGTCTRARLSTDGKLFTCLFASEGHDLRALLRDPAKDDGDLAAALGGIWAARGDRYSELRSSLGRRRAGRIEMSYIGG